MDHGGDGVAVGYKTGATEKARDHRKPAYKEALVCDILNWSKTECQFGCISWLPHFTATVSSRFSEKILSGVVLSQLLCTCRT